MAVETVLLQALLKLRSSDPSFAFQIKHLESIHQIKITLIRQLHLRSFQFPVMTQKLFQNCDQFILILNIQGFDPRQEAVLRFKYIGLNMLLGVHETVVIHKPPVIVETVIKWIRILHSLLLFS